MAENFDYNDVFMGVFEGKKKNYKLSFRDDYRLKRLTEALKLKKGKLLDVGCGGGLLTESLVYYYPKTKIFGCDVSRTAINYAKKFGSGKVSYSVITSKRLPYKDNTFDALVCLDVMEHIPDVNFFLKEVKRILKKEGKFFLLVPCEGEPFTFTWFFKKIKIGDKLTFKNFGHIHPEFTHRNVTEFLQDQEFLIKRKTYSEHIFYQIINFFMYFLPKEIMELFLGKSSVNYLDRGIVDKKVNGKRNADIMDLVRNFWLTFGKFLDRIVSIEIESLKNLSFSAWKIHLLAQNKK